MIIDVNYNLFPLDLSRQKDVIVHATATERTIAAAMSIRTSRIGTKRIAPVEIVFISFK